MSVKTTTHSTSLIDTQSLSALGKASAVIIGSICMVLSAWTVIPFWPVESSMQPLMAVLLGVFLGPRLGAAAVLTYLAEGMLGLPVYASASVYPGLSIFLKPSAGFLMSFPIAAYVAGVFSQRERLRTWKGVFGPFVMGTLIIYAMGMPYLIAFVGWKIAWTNFVLWIPGNIAKIGFGMAIVKLYGRSRFCKKS